jgi:diguanylate cyclase (GGDEF)-like protein
MQRRDWGWVAADHLGRLERDLRDSPVIIPGAAAVIVAAAAGHAILEASAVGWISALAVAVAALAAGERALWLAVTAAVLHAGVDIAVGAPTWFAEPVVQGIGILAIGAFGAAAGTLMRRYEETRRRSLDEDAVTGLLNVRAFYEGLHELRGDNTPYAVLLVDIAGMRNLNERYGHPTGTEAVRALGHVLRKATKSSDLVARLGSDEVAVALVGANRAGALTAARRLSRLLQEERIALPDGRAFRVHAHYGIATSTDLPDGDDVALLRAADHAKLAAKLHGVDEIGVAADDSDENFEIVGTLPPGQRGLVQDLTQDSA